MIELTLPWPPSVNHYWQRNANGTMRISKKGLGFRDCVAWLVAQKNLSAGLSSPVCVVITAYAPDNRRRDLDNIQKALLDSLTHAGVWGDDDQVDDLRIFWARDKQTGKKMIAGMVKVQIEAVE